MARFFKFATLLVLATLWVVNVCAAATSEAAEPSSPLAATADRSLQVTETKNYVITMNNGITPYLTLFLSKYVLDTLADGLLGVLLGTVTKLTRALFIDKLVQALIAGCLADQVPVLALLNLNKDLYESFESFWISNQIVVRGAKLELLQILSPVLGLCSIAEELLFPAPESIDIAYYNTSTSTAAWGVSKIGAPQVWNKNYAGENVVVGTIDTGVRGTHEALVNSMRPTYNWYDPENKSSTPYDNNGHGTHTMGTIVGDYGTGVAPGAKWITCRGCSTSSCPQSLLLACGQFMTCPTDTNGNQRDCSKAPNVVSNSWVASRGSTAFKSMIDVWSAAGIFPVFAAGNTGSACSTGQSPGDVSNAIAVGSCDSTDALSSFSGKGPAYNGLVKPDLCAPGASVRSAYSTSNSAYATISGTSMAAPHVAGVAALLLSKKPTLTFAQLKAALTGTTTRTLASTGMTCGGTSDTTYPNNQYGYGRLNALSAFNSVSS